MAVGAITFAKNGNAVLNGTKGDDNISITKGTEAGTYDVTINGEKSTYTAAQLNGLKIKSKGGNDHIEIGEGVDLRDLKIRTGGGADTVVNHADGADIRTRAGADQVTNYGDDVTVKTGRGGDSVANYGKNVSMFGYNGADTFHNYGANALIKGERGPDKIYNHGAEEQPVEPPVDSGESLVSPSSESGPIGDDGLPIPVETPEPVVDPGGIGSSIIGGGGADTIVNHADDVIIQGKRGPDDIQNFGSLVTIDPGKGKDSVTSDHKEGEVTVKNLSAFDRLVSNGKVIINP